MPIAVVPGQVLNDLYIEFGSRLLEGNVRSFLSARGKVNKSIQNTIKKYGSSGMMVGEKHPQPQCLC
ncbi:MAG: hypothetical protein HDR28_02460 [Lachnospiraceae bacterium]|nr:hypothetical protein [Lachnospiraceae bacterium]